MFMVPPAGFEPTTDRLKAECSTTELRRHGGGGQDSNLRPLGYEPSELT